MTLRYALLVLIAALLVITITSLYDLYNYSKEIYISISKSILDYSEMVLIT